jgi:formate dehydrogenase iron-sulfur subunit
MAETAFLLDLGRCIGCQACVVACKTGNELGPGQQFIELFEQTRGTFPDLEGGFKNHRCLHCLDAACVAVCPTGALFKEGAMTRLNRGDCSGCGYCVESCPFGVPTIFEGRSSKCDGCAATVQAGGEPWCVITCPSRALEWGDRTEIVALARDRASQLRLRYPRAQVYGETEAGGLGVLIVLPDDPEVLELPVDPQAPAVAQVWQSVVQPAAVGVSAATAVAAGIGAVIARRNHMKEVAEIEGADAGVLGEPEPGEED